MMKQSEILLAGKKLILFFLFFGSLYASDQFETTKTCKGCHPVIYSEFYESAHRKSSIFEDEIHKAIWDKHPNKAKDKYSCAKCHTPTDTRVINALNEAKKAVPKKEAIQTQEAISCVYCHSITDVEKHSTPHDKNILTSKKKTIFSADKNNRDGKIIYKEEKSLFGLFKKTSGSPFHNIDYSNKGFYTGKMCMGCHSHFENSHGQNICTVEETGANNEEKNCISCHMPKIDGSATTIKITKKHTFHGFAGARNKPQMLAKYLKLGFNNTTTGFEVTVKNEATHKFLTHPLRLAKLNIRVNNGSKTTKLKSVPFFRILGNKGKPTMPWLATEVFKETMLKAGEKRTIKYDTKLKSGDIVEVEFGYYLVNPKMHKKLNLESSEEATKFNILKTEFFTVQ